MQLHTATGTDFDVAREFCLMREIAGTELNYLKNLDRPIFDMAPVVPSPYPVKATYTTTFRMPKTDGGKRRLLIEGRTLRGSWTMSLNGHPLTDADFAADLVYDFTNRTADVTAWLQEENTLTVSFDEAAEFDGLESAMYII